MSNLFVLRHRYSEVIRAEQRLPQVQQAAGRSQVLTGESAPQKGGQGIWSGAMCLYISGNFLIDAWPVQLTCASTASE